MNWRYSCLPGLGPDSQTLFSVIAKRTYGIAPGKLALCEKQPPLVESDEFADPHNPFYSDCTAESDLVAYKPATDVIIKGRAWAPRGKQAYSLECEAAVGPLGKTVRVFGNRSLEQKMVRGFSLGAPEPFSSMELGYARAYGGTAKSKTGTLLPYYPNQIGRGFSIKGGFGDAGELLVPNLEDPSSPVTADSLIVDKYEDWPKAPKPASFGWTRRDFYPRYTYCGVPPLFLEGAGRQAGTDPQDTTDKKMQRMDPRFYQGASEGLGGVRLRGNEQVTLKYFDPDMPVFQFALPEEKPVIIADLGNGRNELSPVVQTVIIDMDKKLLSIIWRGSCPIESFEAIERLEVKVVDCR